MKIVIPTFERIEWMPPTITLIKKLAKMGFEVVYITLYPDDYFEAESYGTIRNVFLCRKSICLTEMIPYTKGISGLLYRIDKLIKRIIAAKLSAVLRKEMTDDAFLWVVNEMTVLLAGSSFLRNYRYLFSIYELHERSFKKRHIEKAAQHAVRVIVPEYCRAHIIKSRYRLKLFPIVLPNKSDVPYDNTELPELAQEAVDRIKLLQEQGSRIVLYMGGISKERPLDNVIEAFRGQIKYRLVLIGRESTYLKELQSKYPDGFEYLGAFTPPLHLLVARYADIGLLMYVSINREQGLNALFCAPNKIYEYTGLGLPVIANDIPGLRFEVLPNRIGKVVNFEETNDILDALDEICSKYEEYEINAKNYFENVDIAQIITNVLSNLF